jgi:SAM-dependent methyltransferase
MLKALNCTLCGAAVEYLTCFRDNKYYRCTNCRSVMMDSAGHLPPEVEKNRYDQHNNDVDDPGYRSFVKPLVEIVLKKYTPEARGLDYGAGPGPVAAVILKEKGFKIDLYDPYYWDNRELLDKKYDYIICCEVIEHFSNPAKEFRLLRSLLLPRGSLVCMTEIYNRDIDFEQWYYKNDPTHVFFYAPRALSWIKKEYGFTELTVEKRLVHFER